VLWSRLLFLSLALSLSLPALAERTKELDQRLCEGMLGTTLLSAEPNFEFDLMAGLGMRGFLGAYPESTGTEAAAFATKGVMFWGHSFSVKKSVEEAKAHDAQFKGLEKIMYLISQTDVSDLSDETPDDIVRERFARIFAEGHMVYWDDSESIVKKDPGIPAKFVQVDMLSARRLIVAETIGYFTMDDRGPRFTQSGWVFPKIRGELNYARVFESGSGTIKNALRYARKLTKEGYTVTFNQNFQEALDAARDQIRFEKNFEGVEGQVQNSRYRESETYLKALEGYRSGHSFSVEVRNAEGKLISGVLGERHGNIIALETIFYGYDRNPDGSLNSKKSKLDEAKIAVLAALQRMHEYGIDVADAGMVTPFTASLKGEYVPAEQFARDIAGLSRMAPIDLDFARPWQPAQ